MNWTLYPFCYNQFATEKKIRFMIGPLEGNNIKDIHTKSFQNKKKN